MSVPFRRNCVTADKSYFNFTPKLLGSSVGVTKKTGNIQKKLVGNN